MVDKNSSFLQMIRRDRRGRLKVYLGYSAGVGKTFAMLQEAHRIRSEGVEVAVGAVETHGRGETAALLEGLETIPLRRNEFRGMVVEEMDLAAILTRRPQVVLVDGLEHMNAPGSSNAKRHQDVEEILAAGINVITTLNVQHLESLYDTVEKFTHVKVRDRLPDAALAEADQIVNVDISPEDLQKRLKGGKILPGERVAAALENHFQSSRLEQLRELTLREVASQIDARRREASGEGNSAATEQVMVCLDARYPGNASLLRYGSRLAGRLNRNWYAVCVRTLDERSGGEDSARGLPTEDLALANRLGATVFTLKGNDAAEALMGFAKEYRVGHVVVGKPFLRPWWKRLMGNRGVVDRLLRSDGGFTISVIDAQFGLPPAPADKAPDAILLEGNPGEKLRLTDFLGPQCILSWEESVSKLQVMRDLLQALRGVHPELDAEKMLGKLLERESKGSTFLNEGIALPHARIENLPRPLVALGVCHGGILDAFATEPVEIVFLLLSPKEENRSHLQLLAVAGRLMQNRALRAQLRKEHDAQEVYLSLQDLENPQP